MYILGIHCGHDATAALIKDGTIVAVIQEERKVRIKHQNGFPSSAIQEVLRIGGVTSGDIDYIAFAGYDRRLESIKEFFWAIKGRRFYSYAGMYKRFKTLIAENTKAYWKLQRNLKNHGLQNTKCFYFEHHLCHASSAYRNSGMKEALILTIDGVGDDVAASVNIGKDGVIKRIAVTLPENSIGLLYQAVTEALGFVPVEGEYKTMGLAAYGDRTKLYDYFKNIVSYKKLGFQSKYTWESEWRFPAPTIQQHIIFKDLLKNYKREDIAASCQAVVEELICQFVEEAVKATGITDVCVSGGVFLNVKANKLIRERLHLKSFYIHPDAGDAGLALGAALELYFKLKRYHAQKSLEHVYFGTVYSNAQIEESIKKYNVTFKYFDDITKKTAEVLYSGKVVGWFQNKMEMGPRALGCRSVLADPRNSEVKEKINLHLKKRDWFVPFAPSILEEDAKIYIKDFDGYAPFMIMAYEAVPGADKRIPAVVHVDGTLRPQIVKKDINPSYWKLIKSFKELSGVGVLLNTSFNRHGLPIVESPDDALMHLVERNVDVLSMGNYIIERKE